jgi:hypothetical protein
MEMQQMVECLLAKMDTNQAEMKPYHKNGWQSKGNRREMLARMDSQVEKMEDCLGNMEDMDMETNLEERRICICA